MDTIDRTLKYVDLYLVHNNLNNIIDCELPNGYKFVYFNKGDEKDWVEIEMSAGEFLSFEEGMEAFNYYYKNHYEELKKLCIFIENENGQKIATATAFYLDVPENDITGNVHWVSVRKEYQGKHLSKPLISETLKQLRRLGHKKTLLHTQTHTWLAVKVYMDMGFEPYKMEENYLGWQIIKKLTNHKKLKDIDDLEEKNMYNPLYIQAYEFLKEKFKEPFIYKVWDDKINIIGINDGKSVHKYTYEFNNNKLKIIENKNKFVQEKSRN